MEYLLIFLLSSVKFAMTFPIAVFAKGLTAPVVYLITTLGGISGATFFVYAWGEVVKFLRKRNIIFFRRNKPVFTKRSRRLAYVKSNYGFWGLVILTPVLFSIPLGALILAAYYPNKRRIIKCLTLTIAIWSFIMVIVLFTFRDWLSQFF
ncbi:MAG TPA: hypothetical protein VJ937_03315 [Salinivirga sp.]|uniref:Small multi-drug export protein n=1 Tax=Salinivirga cyanobacteriivorans TaxID=1307839 RepID=A0A0S2HYP2_9BACT|nr:MULTISPECIES: hypothetical protein [Salinivirga]ALO15124.1 hypothetical protein L21SP5_01474 [Salinivirga cyanobacteriivorans]HKK58481.1 hypothetical protein [Salinivirga sp.]